MILIMLLTASPFSLLQVCVERTRRRPLMLLNLMYISLLPVSPAQRIVSPAVVTGYLRQNVSLPCKFIPGPTNDQITQVQWGFKENEWNETIILVSNQELGIKIHDTFLKDKVAIKEQALIISHLEERDAGAYTCKISAFPGGSFGASIQLLVEAEQLLLSSAEVSAIVIAVLLLLLMATVVYFMFFRRLESSARCCLHVDTRGPAAVSPPDLVYSDIKIKRSADAPSSSSHKCADTAASEDVTYAEVLVLQQQSNSNKPIPE
ncbi:nectin-3-like protein isoform X1 [Takifugu flavidus]|uniref:nectin-3-like protein isoform X1 n=2 Tax=Takifugu flavidus TaxID=433684 RepID=UPI002544B49D|nr:nectin-3-like protein isoform X1 [Takifugu flavidus]